jgi:hypothetical protein
LKPRSARLLQRGVADHVQDAGGREDALAAAVELVEERGGKRGSLLRLLRRRHAGTRGRIGGVRLDRDRLDLAERAPHRRARHRPVEVGDVNRAVEVSVAAVLLEAPERAAISRAAGGVLQLILRRHHRGRGAYGLGGQSGSTE